MKGECVKGEGKKHQGRSYVVPHSLPLFKGADQGGGVHPSPFTLYPSLRTGEVRGFTLIEMLVVLMIMGLFVGLVSTITLPDDRAVLQLEAERLSQLLDFAAAEAQLTGKSIAWTADESGYRFWRAGDDSGWSEIRDGEVLRARTLPQGMTVSGFRVENMRPQGAMRLEFAPHGSPLAFTIGMSLGAEHCAVTGSPIGDVRVAPVQGGTNGEVALR